MLSCGRTIMQHLPLVHNGNKMPNLPIHNHVLIFILGNGTCDLARKNTCEECYIKSPSN